MSDSDFDKRKTSRRENIEHRFLNKKADAYDSRDINKMKKQLKKQKENIRAEELWEDWENEIS
jgi:hypothetical protein